VLRAALLHKLADIEALAAALSEAQANRQVAEVAFKEIEAIRQSTSWKITMPLRRLAEVWHRD
jgi:hypothetical protein